MMVRNVREVRKATRATRTAFTLLEVLVVVAIIVMLAGVGGYYVLQRYEEAKVSKARADCLALAEQCEIYKLHNNDTPPGSIAALTTNQPNGDGPLVPPDKVKDPWGKDYQIDSNGLKIRVFTSSPKGKMIDSSGGK
jgi:general secretion pathway protein G